MKPFLLEIGTEEIPARFIRKGLAILQEALSGYLTDSAIQYGPIHQYATPRRLTLLIEDVAEKQEDRTVTSVGPPKNIAYDKNGEPTKAATGFAKSLNIDVSNLQITETEKGEYICATVEEKGLPSPDCLADALPKIITSLQLPKSMRWGDSSIRFFRPIHWIIALYGDRVVPFEIDGIKTANISYGHRFLSPSAIKISKPEDYLSELARNHVIADMKERQALIEKGIQQCQTEKGCVVHEDRELIETVTNLVEYPTVVLGSFEDKYLALPKELPITVMRSHQKYFSTENNEGNLLRYFLVVSNTKPENNETVRIGAERVLRARLEDAQFYYTDDKKLPLIEYVEKLKDVTFQEKLGTLYDKTERVASLSSFIASRFNVTASDNIIRASKLAKADLVTGVVSEFPELQGYMGMIYALHAGEDNAVAVAIQEHYLPRFPGDSLPSDTTGTIISLADKMDNIASFFYVGLIPTGSEDPYALRRQATGIIQILKSGGYSLSLDLLAHSALQPLESSEEKRRNLTRDIIQFFHQRLEGILLAEGYRHDLISAVLSSDQTDIQDVDRRLKLLAALKESPTFPNLLIAAKRVYNILSKTEPLELQESMLTEHAERALFESARSIKENLSISACQSLFEFEAPVNTFFDKVLVMDKDPLIRDNRLALLQSVKKVFNLLGDFSKIVED
ncbi:MAG: glycine--tRNA ligase subunit beta [Nitrospiraceae bacterium]|nr:MAG: glycine--tRNA ligase subunit beta [Nitrospiraceae bacterium]